MGVKTNKAEYFEKLKGLLEDYKSIFIVGVDNVSFTFSSEMKDLGQFQLQVANFCVFGNKGFFPADA